MSNFLDLLCRILEWVVRFLRGIQAFGLSDAITVFFRSNRRVRGNIRNLLSIKVYNRVNFYFRQGLDHAIFPHFYEKEYYINTVNGYEIKSILDAGANIGSQTTRFYLLYPSATIVSIEAEPENFNVLKQNYIHIKSVNLIHGALWSSSGEVSITGNPSEPVGFSVSDQLAEGVKVPSYSVQDILAITGWNEIDIFKIDIEGAEYEVFNYKSDEWVSKVKCFIIEVPDHEKPGTMQLIYSKLSAHKFNTFLSGENIVLIRADLPWKLENRRRLGTISSNN